MTATEEVAYQWAFPEAPAATLTLPRHFEPKTPPSNIKLESDTNATERMTITDKPLPIPPPSIKYDTRPSLFAPPPKSAMRITKANPPVFPQSRFTEWMKSPTTCDELLGKLVRNTSPAAEQFSTFIALRKHTEETKKIRENVTEMKDKFKEFKKLGQKIEKRLDDIHARITKAEDLQA